MIVIVSKLLEITPMPLSVGDKLGPYEIVAPLGAGGMGEVWKARDTRLNRIVAIKRLKGAHSARFEQEARAIAALNHPHICQIHDFGLAKLTGDDAEATKTIEGTVLGTAAYMAPEQALGQPLDERSDIFS